MIQRSVAIASMAECKPAVHLLIAQIQKNDALVDE